MGYFTDIRKEQWTTWEVKDEFRWVLLVVVLQCIQYFHCLILAGAPREKIFTQEFLDENFKEEHEKALGYPLQKGGYPDHGSGRFIMKAGYEAWMQFNNAQRIQVHYMESITQILTQQLICGLYWPMPTLVIGIIYLVGRAIFTYGYLAKGAKGRMFGAPFVLLV